MFLSESVLCRFRDITTHTVGDYFSAKTLVFSEKFYTTVKLRYNQSFRLFDIECCIIC